MELWFVVALASGVLSNTVSIFLRTILKREKDALAYAWFFNLCRLILFLIILPFDYRLDMSLEAIGVLVMLGIVEFVSIYFLMKTYEVNQLSLSVLILRARLIWVAGLSFLFLGESLTIMSYVGLLVLFFGISVAVSPKRVVIDSSIQYAYIASVTTAIVNIFMKLSGDVASVSVIMIAMSLPGVLLFPLFMKNPTHRIKKTVTQNLPFKLLVGFLNAGALYLLLFAITVGDVSIAVAANQGMVIIGVIAGIMLFREHNDLGRKIIGFLLTIVGILFLANS